MSGYQGYPQGQRSGGCDEGRTWGAPRNPHEGWHSEMSLADSVPVSQVKPGGAETYKRRAPYSGEDFAGAPKVKRSCFKTGGLHGKSQGQEADWRHGMTDEADRSSTFFVFNLMLKTTTSDLFKYFVKFGDLMKFHVFSNNEGKSTGTGVIQFVNEEAAHAVLAAEPHFIHKKQVLISHDQDFDPKTNESVKRSLEQHTLYVSDIHLDASEEDLCEYFSKWGNISICDIVERAKRMRNTKYGFVSFANHEDAVKCLSVPHIYRQTKMNVYMSEKWKTQMQPEKDSEKTADGARYEETNMLYVNQIPDGVTPDELVEHFSMWGKLKVCRISGRAKQNNNFFYGFVSFQKQEDALTALIMPHTLRNQRVSVRVADKTTGTANLMEAARDSEIMSAVEQKVKNCYLFAPTLSASITKEDLYEHFKKYGRLASCMIIPNGSRLTAFITYVKENDAARCLSDIHFLKNTKLNLGRSYFTKWGGKDIKASDLRKSDAQAAKPTSPARPADPHGHTSHAGPPKSATSPRHDRHASPPRQNRRASPPRQNRRASPPRLDTPASPPRQDRHAGPLRHARPASPSRQDRRASPPRHAGLASLPRQDRLACPPRQDRHAGPLRHARPASPPRQDRHASPPRHTGLTSLPRQDRCSSPPRHAKPASPPRQDRHLSPPRHAGLARDISLARLANPGMYPMKAYNSSKSDAPAQPAGFARPGIPDRPTIHATPAIPDRRAHPVPQNTEPPNRKLKISGLAAHTPGYKLMCYFSRWGRVEDFDVVKDVRLRPTGCAFVIFEKHGDAEKAVSDKPHVIDDKEVEVTYAKHHENLPSKDLTSLREQRPNETIQQQRLPESVISLDQGSNPPEAREPRRLLEGAQPRRLAEVYQPRRQSTPEHLTPGLTQVDSIPDTPLVSEYECNVSGCSFKGKSGQFERHWTMIHEAKVLYLICSFCTMGCVDPYDLREHLDFFHGIEDKTELSSLLLGARQQEKDNIHFIMPGSVTRETCMKAVTKESGMKAVTKESCVKVMTKESGMKVVKPPQKKDAKDVHSCPECTFTGTVDEFINHWDKYHLSGLNYLRCPKCPKTFTKKDFLLLHIKNQHQNTEIKTEKETEDIEDNSERSQSINIGSSLLERAYHEFERQVLPTSETDIPTVSDIGSRSTGNRSMQTKPRASLSAPLQCSQDVQSCQLPILPSQLSTPPVPPPLASQVATQAVPLHGQVTPFYPSMASIPQTGPPAPTPPPLHAASLKPAPLSIVGSKSYPPAHPQLPVPGIVSTSTLQPVVVASKLAVSTQSYIVPSVNYSQATFQSQVSAHSLQTCVVTSPHTRVVAAIAPSVVPQSSQGAAPLQQSASAQPSEFVEEQPPVALTDFDMSSIETQGKENIQEKIPESQSAPEVVIEKKVNDVLKRSVQSGSVLAQRPEWTKPLKVAQPKKLSLDKNTSGKISSFTTKVKYIPKFDKTHPDSIQKFLIWNHLMMERLEDADIKVRRRLKADGELDVAEGDDDEDPEGMFELSSDEETGDAKSTAVKGTLSQAREDMKARAQTVAEKVVADYRRTNRYTNATAVSVASNKRQTGKGVGKQRMPDRKVLGQLFHKSASMIRYQCKRANVDADLVRQGISLVKQDIRRMLEQNHRIKCETDEESKRASFSVKSDDHSRSFQKSTDKDGQSKKGRRDNSDQSRKEYQDKTENRRWAREDLHQRTGNGDRTRKECRQWTENRRWASEDLQQRTGNGDRSRKERQQRTENRGRANENLQQRSGNGDRSRKEHQHNCDQSGDKYHHRTENRGQSREEFADGKVEKEELVEVYMDENVNEDEEYALAYVDEDGVHVMDDGFVMGQGGHVEMDEEKDDFYHGMDRGSRRKSIRREQDMTGYGGETRRGHRNIGDKDFYSDGRNSQEEYLKGRDDDRTCFSSVGNSSVSKRRNEDGRSQRFELQRPRESDFAEEDEYFDPEKESFDEEGNEEFIHCERVVEVVNYDEHEEALDTAWTESAEQDGRILPQEENSFGRVGQRLDRDRGFSNQRDRFKRDNSVTRRSQERGSRAHSKSSSADKSVRPHGEKRNRGREIRKHDEHFRKDNSVTRNRKDFVDDVTTKPQKLHSKQTDNRDNQRNSRNQSKGDKVSSSRTESQYLKKEGVDAKSGDQMSSGNKSERTGGDSTEGDVFEWEQDDLSEGALSGDGSLCDFDMDDIDMDDFVVMDEL